MYRCVCAGVVYVCVCAGVHMHVQVQAQVQEGAQEFEPPTL